MNFEKHVSSLEENVKVLQIYRGSSPAGWEAGLTILSAFSCALGTQMSVPRVLGPECRMLRVLPSLCGV